MSQKQPNHLSRENLMRAIDFVRGMGEDKEVLVFKSSEDAASYIAKTLGIRFTAPNMKSLQKMVGETSRFRISGFSPDGTSNRGVVMTTVFKRLDEMQKRISDLEDLYLKLESQRPQVKPPVPVGTRPRFSDQGTDRT